jgi:hypothetical protein
MGASWRSGIAVFLEEPRYSLVTGSISFEIVLRMLFPELFRIRDCQATAKVPTTSPTRALAQIFHYMLPGVPLICHGI